MINLNIYVKFGVKEQNIITVSEEEKTIIFRPWKLNAEKVMMFNLLSMFFSDMGQVPRIGLGIVYKLCKYLLN